MGEKRRRFLFRRIRRHAVLLLAAVTVTGGVDLANSSSDAIARASFASAYAALLFLCATLLIGPFNVFRGRPNPTSTHLRRDVGIWAAVLGLLHTALGLNVHLRGRLREYFIVPRSGEGLPAPRVDIFGLANYAGLGAAAVLAILLALSNDVSLRTLGTQRWKALQRWNYTGFSLIVVHGALYQVLEERPPSWSLVFGAMVALTAAVQVAGYFRRRASRMS